ncbi:hypothetical protein ACN28S_42680 [Cystobacter fuscus]
METTQPRLHLFVPIPEVERPLPLVLLVRHALPLRECTPHIADSTADDVAAY